MFHDIDHTIFASNQGPVMNSMSIWALILDPLWHANESSISTSNPNDPYFWRSTPQNKAFSNQNRGHLGSRYWQVQEIKFIRHVKFAHSWASSMSLCDMSWEGAMHPWEKIEAFFVVKLSYFGWRNRSKDGWRLGIGGWLTKVWSKLAVFLCWNLWPR